MSYPWFDAIRERQPQALEGAVAVERWLAAMAARPAVHKGMNIDP